MSTFCAEYLFVPIYRQCIKKCRKIGNFYSIYLINLIDFYIKVSYNNYCSQ